MTRAQSASRLPPTRCVAAAASRTHPGRILATPLLLCHPLWASAPSPWQLRPNAHWSPTPAAGRLLAPISLLLSLARSHPSSPHPPAVPPSTNNNLPPSPASPFPFHCTTTPTHHHHHHPHLLLSCSAAPPARTFSISPPHPPSLPRASLSTSRACLIGRFSLADTTSPQLLSCLLFPCRPLRLHLSTFTFC